MIRWLPLVFFSSAAVGVILPINAERSLNECYGEAEIRTEVVYCLEEEVGQSQAKLGKAFEEAAAHFRSIDEELDQTRLYSALVQAQEAFADFRESQCQLQMEIAFPGSGAGDIYKACVIAYNNWRAEILQGLPSP